MKFGSLKLLADENISPRLVDFLRQKGLDVIDVKEKGWQGAEDNYLMDLAVADERYILTHDSDFGTMSLNAGVACYGIIYLRLRDLRISHITGVIEKLLLLDKEFEKETLIVVEDARIRIRTILHNA